MGSYGTDKSRSTHSLTCILPSVPYQSDHQYPLEHAYWWTNIAVKNDVQPNNKEQFPTAPEQVRILTPARNWVSDAGISAFPPWPKFIGSNWMATGSWDKNESRGNWCYPEDQLIDHSYPYRWWEKCDVWLSDQSVLERHINYNGFIDGGAGATDGNSMIHVHPNNGTKAWMWGSAPNERYWQDLGGGPTQYNYYTELQTGERLATPPGRILLPLAHGGPSNAFSSAPLSFAFF